MTAIGAPTSLAELLDEAVPFRIRLNAQFRGVCEREGWLIRGSQGWGEFAPFDDYSPQLAARWLSAAIDAAWGEPLQLHRTEVPVNAIIPVAPAVRVAELVRMALVRGCSTVKVKVGTDDLASDVARVALIRSLLDENLGEGVGRIRLDANAAWSLERAQESLPRLVDAAVGIEYVEQPCAELADCARIRSAGLAPVAIDEGLRLAADLEDQALWSQLHEAADVLVVKPIPLGGVAHMLAVAQRFAGPVVVSSSLDTSIGLMYGVRAAAALPELVLACGLGTGVLLADDLVGSTVLPCAGAITVEDIAPDAELIARYRIDRTDARYAYWHQRIADAAAVLAGFGSVEL